MSALLLNDNNVNRTGIPIKQVFSTPGSYSYTAAVTGTMTVKLWGSAGAGRLSVYGGAGGYTTITLAVTSGQTFQVCVGGKSESIAYQGFPALSSNDRRGGDASSFLSFSGSIYTALAIAGGGGGGRDGVGGAGGGIIGQDGGGSLAGGGGSNGSGGLSITHDTSFRSIAWAPELNLFCMVGLNLRATSTNGTTWITDWVAQNYVGVAWSPQLGIFCAIESGGNVITSTNGTTWNSTSTVSGTWKSICWSPNLSLFCIVGTNSIAISSNAITWTVTTVSGSWASVCWSPELSLFCAVGTNRQAISSNGTSWTSTTATGFFTSVCWSPQLSLFCAVAIGNPSVITSSNGSIWTTRLTGQPLSAVCWSPELSLFCATRTDGFYISSNGISWTLVGGVGGNGQTAIVWASSLGIFCASVSTLVSISSNGTSWTRKTIPNTILSSSNLTGLYNGNLSGSSGGFSSGKGGGGYGPGGAGESDLVNGSGGGGGGGYVSPSVITGFTTAGNGTTPPNNTDQDYLNAGGNFGNGVVAGNGLIVISVLNNNPFDLTPFISAPFNFKNYFSPSSYGFYASNYIPSTSVSGSSPTTVSSASSLHIAGPPTAGSNWTNTNSYALNIASGGSVFGGPIKGNASSNGINESVLICPNIESTTATSTLQIVPSSTTTWTGGIAQIIMGDANHLIRNQFSGDSSGQMEFIDINGFQFRRTSAAASLHTSVSNIGDWAFTRGVSITPTTNQLILGTTNTTTINATAPTASRIYTIPDAGGNANFILSTSGSGQTIAGGLTSSSTLNINPTTNQLVLGTTNTTTINATAPTASRIYTIPDAGGNANFILSTSGSGQTIAGGLTSSGIVSIINTTQSTSATTGALTVRGGIGMGTGLSGDPPVINWGSAYTTGRKHIALFDNTNSNTDFRYFGFGISTNQLDYTVGSTSNSHVFYAGGNVASARNELLRITGNGQAQFQNTSGSNGRFTILTQSDISQENLITGTWIRNDGANTVFSTTVGDLYYGFGYRGSQSLNHFFCGGTGTIHTTATASGRWNFSGSQSTTVGAFAFYAYNGSVNTGTNAGGTSNYSIVAASRIAATEFNATSSRKIKVIRPLDYEKIISSFEKIPLYEYDYKDKIKNTSATIYGLVAEELASIFPAYVDNSNDEYVPNIFQNAIVRVVENKSIIQFENPVDIDKIEKMDSVMIITEKEEIHAPIIFNNPKEAILDKIVNYKSIFVYGTKETCPTITKNHVFELGLCITQYLLQKYKEQRNEIEALKQKNIDLESRIAIIESKLQNI